jgi:hypothetical protein
MTTAGAKIRHAKEHGPGASILAGKEKKLLAEMNMGSSVYTSPVPANGVLFIANRNQLFALAEKKQLILEASRS